MKRPPPTLDCAQVIEFAITDESVKFEQRYTLNVGGEWLGEVPNLAICKNLDESKYMVFHCNADWEVLGVAAGYVSAQEAREKVERSYHGLKGKWIPSEYTREEAEKYVRERFKNERCSFCGRIPPEFQMVIGEDVRICNHCVDSFYQIMHESNEDT